jgi:hypothetical protein
MSDYRAASGGPECRLFATVAETRRFAMAPYRDDDDDGDDDWDDDVDSSDDSADEATVP